MAPVALRAAMEAPWATSGGRKGKAKPRLIRTMRRDGRELVGLGAAIGALVTERAWELPAAGARAVGDHRSRDPRAHRQRRTPTPVSSRCPEPAAWATKARIKQTRIIAAANNPAPAPPPTRAHPRGRGKQRPWWFPIAETVGPSSLARGARLTHRRAEARPGTIPARAGSTAGGSARIWRPGDHPRSRGEHTANSSTGFTGTGPSPLARGAHRSASRSWSVRGTIPARAGSTQIAYRMDVWEEDHPRSRGEHSF